MVTGIIGAGASGMAAALAAAENESGQVVLMERQARVGRKLQATGNGRCNLSNLHGASGGYHGENPGFADYALGKFPPTAALEWFRSLGLLTVAEDSGRVYPYSDQANSVVDVLRFALEKPNITIKLGFEAKKVKKTAGLVLNKEQEESFEILRALRAEIAREEKVPPYIVFSDKTLVQMCIEKPTNKNAMLKVSGVGEFKFEKYGERFLEVIRSWT